MYRGTLQFRHDNKIIITEEKLLNRELGLAWLRDKVLNTPFLMYASIKEVV